jgi:hypothetical protein
MLRKVRPRGRVRHLPFGRARERDDAWDKPYAAACFFSRAGRFVVFGVAVTCQRS